MVAGSRRDDEQTTPPEPRGRLSRRRWRLRPFAARRRWRNWCRSSMFIRTRSRSGARSCSRGLSAPRPGLAAVDHDACRLLHRGFAGGAGHRQLHHVRGHDPASWPRLLRRSDQRPPGLSPPGPAGPVPSRDRIKGLLAFDGSRFTSSDFTNVLLTEKIKISMDGKGAWRDDVFVAARSTNRCHRQRRRRSLPRSGAARRRAIQQTRPAPPAHTPTLASRTTHPPRLWGSADDQPRRR